MNLNQAATLLGWSRQQMKAAIDDGLDPFGRGDPVRLKATPRPPNDFEIEDEALDAFVGAFEAAEPGRHPPVSVRRALLFEAREACCICGTPGPFDFHHMIDWGKLQHHDPSQMMLLCKNCHGKCTKGEIDYERQKRYKQAPHASQGLRGERTAFMTITWEDLRSVVQALRDHIGARVPSDIGHDFTYTSIERKNNLNNLSPDFFEVLRSYEPKFILVDRFLRDERNEAVRGLYYEVVGDLKTAIAGIQGKNPDIPLDDVLLSIFDQFFESLKDRLERLNREAVRLLVAFMYFACDIGRK